MLIRINVKEPFLDSSSTLAECPLIRNHTVLNLTLAEVAESVAGQWCQLVPLAPKASCLCPHVNLYRALKEVVLTA